MESSEFKTVSTVGVNQIRPASPQCLLKIYMCSLVLALHGQLNSHWPRVKAGALIWCRWKGNVRGTQRSVREFIFGLYIYGTSPFMQQ